jgi:hypothetical protein
MDAVCFDKNLDTIFGLGPAIVAGDEAANERADQKQANDKRRPTDRRSNC